MKTENEGNAESVHPDMEQRRLSEVRQMSPQQQFDLAAGIFLGTRPSLEAMWSDLMPRIGTPEKIAGVLHTVARARICPRLRFVGDSVRFLPFDGSDLPCINMADVGYLHARALLPLLGFLRISAHDPHKHISTSYIATSDIHTDNLERFRPLILHFISTKLVLSAPASERDITASLMETLWNECFQTPFPEWSELSIDEHIKKINVVY